MLAFKTLVSVYISGRPWENGTRRKIRLDNVMLDHGSDEPISMLLSKLRRPSDTPSTSMQQTTVNSMDQQRSNITNDPTVSLAAPSESQNADQSCMLRPPEEESTQPSRSLKKSKQTKMRTPRRTGSD
ncbi:hypothetical protein OSTOST_21710 [Ostertagia ostertagi]